MAQTRARKMLLHNFILDYDACSAALVICALASHIIQQPVPCRSTFCSLSDDRTQFSTVLLNMPCMYCFFRYTQEVSCLCTPPGKVDAAMQGVGLAQIAVGEYIFNYHKASGSKQSRKNTFGSVYCLPVFTSFTMPSFLFTLVLGI